MKRRELLRAMAGVGAASLVVPGIACGVLPAVRSGPPTIKIAYLTLGWAGIEIIHHLGLLDPRRWDIEWRPVDAISGLVNAFAAHQVDLIDMSSVIVGQMYEQGVDMRVFG